MIEQLKAGAKRLPYPVFLRVFYAWFFARKLTRLERVRRQACLSRLSAVDLMQHKQSDTLFILGSGPSINRIPPERWQAIARHDSLGVNLWLFHAFVPRFYVVESVAYGGDRDHVAQLIARLANQRAQDYATAIKIITDLYQPGRQYVEDLGPGFRRGLYAAYNLALPARDEHEFEEGVRYLEKKGVFSQTGRMDVLFKYSLSMSLLLTFALRLRYRRVVLCGMDLKTQDYFYQDPTLYPENKDLELVPRGSSHGADKSVPWMLPQSQVIMEMKRLLLEPAGMELYVESRDSALWPALAEAPGEIFSAPTARPAESGGGRA